MDGNDDHEIQTPLPQVPADRMDATAGPLYRAGEQRAYLGHVHTNEAREDPSHTTSRASPVPQEEQIKPPQQQSSQSFVDAINSAFASPSLMTTTTTTPTAVNTLDPTLIKQIASQVFDMLRSSNHVDPMTSFPPHNLPYSPQSPGLSSVASFPLRYTPPSPHRTHDTKDGTDGSISPGHLPSLTGIGFERQSDLDLNMHLRTANTNQLESQPQSECKSDLSERTLTSNNHVSNVQSRNTRRAGHLEVERETTTTPIPDDSDDATILEKIWQPLFVSGRPTARLGQFLRGVARYLIEECEPKGSLVVTPHKMHYFFEETKASQEIYPWSSMFGGKMSPASICTTYRRLLCQHHLVQTQCYEKPAIPGLTPIGFADFMTCLIQAHPDIEFERLSQAVKNMPISNADDVRERFPKELSRRLLPAFGEVQAEQRFISSLNHEISLLNLEHVVTTMPPPPSNPPPLQCNTSVPERVRTPYMRSAQTSATVEDDEPSPPAVAIERERKPYHAKEGTGKIYDSDAFRPSDNDGTREAGKSEGKQHPSNPPSSLRPPRPAAGLSRSESYKGAGRSRPANLPSSESHRKSISHAMPPSLTPGNSHPTSARRSSTPPQFNYARNVDMFGSSNVPASHYPFALQPNNGRDPPLANDPRRYSDGRPLERARTADDGERGDRIRPILTRNTTQAQTRYDQGYNAPGFPSANSFGRVPGPPDGYGPFTPTNPKFHPLQPPYGPPPQR